MSISHLRGIYRTPLNYIVGIESQFLAYKLLGDTINALRTTEEASRLFHRQGYRAQSVRALYYQVPIYLMKQDYNQVARILRKYESEFDCYDENGNVRKGLELLSRMSVFPWTLHIQKTRY